MPWVTETRVIFAQRIMVLVCVGPSVRKIQLVGCLHDCF